MQSYMTYTDFQLLRAFALQGIEINKLGYCDWTVWEGNYGGKSWLNSKLNYVERRRMKVCSCPRFKRNAGECGRGWRGKGRDGRKV